MRLLANHSALFLIIIKVIILKKGKGLDLWVKPPCIKFVEFAPPGVGGMEGRKKERKSGREREKESHIPGLFSYSVNNGRKSSESVPDASPIN